MADFSFIAATDTTRMQSGGTSMFEDVANVFTKGVGAAVVSGVHGIYNTGVDLSNKVFDADIERADTSKTLHELDRDWGQYYDKNKGAIDTAGFVAASFAPGLLAVKGLKMLSAGEASGAFSHVLGFAARKERAYLNAALTDLETAGGNVFTRINGNKLASMAWGTADNVLQAAAFETAAAVTMSSSPLLEKEEWGNIFWDITKSSLAGGAIGGAIGGLLTNKLLKDAGKLVEGKQRLVDKVGAIGEIDVAFGDKAFSSIDALVKLRDDFANPEVLLLHGRADIKDKLDIGPLLDKTLKDSITRKTQQFEQTLVEVVQNDKTVGKPLAAALKGILVEGIESGADMVTIRRTLGDYLHNLVAVEGIGGKPLDVSGELLFINPKADITKVALTREKQIGDLAYRVVGDQSKALSATLGKEVLSVEEAWKKGFDVLFDPQTRQVKVSPFSEIYKKVTDKEVDFAPLFFNTRSKKTSMTTVATAADIQTAQVPLTISTGGVVTGNKAFKFTTGSYTSTDDVVEATARHAWAGSDKLTKVFGRVDTQDISLLDALLHHPEKATPGLELFDAASQTGRLFTNVPDFESFVFKMKYEKAIKLLEGRDPSKVDLREVAYHINVDPAWLEKAVSTEFNMKELVKDRGWFQKLDRFQERENLVFRYDTKAVEAAKESPEGLVAYYQRVKEATARAKQSSALVLGDDFKMLVDPGSTLTATSQAVGATLLGASNANYSDPLRRWAQYTGQIVSQLTNKRVSAALTELQGPAAKLLQNPNAAAEVAAAVTKGRLSKVSLALHQDEFTKRYMIVDLESYMKFKGPRGGPPVFKERYELSEDAGAFIAAHHKLNASRVEQRKVLSASQGIPNDLNPDRLYFPPVDTQRLPFFAFVRQGDGTVFGSSEVAMLTARSAEELAAKAAAIEADKTQNLKVIFKSNAEEYFKAKGMYEFSRTMNEPMIDSTLRSQGKLGDYIPNMTPQAVIEDFMQHTQRAETGILRDAVELNYAQTFAELKDLSTRYTAVQTSKMEGLNKWLRGAVDDPFGDYAKTALNVSKRGEFTLLHQANEFVDALGTRAFRALEGTFMDAKAKKITWEEANLQMEKFGLGKHFTDKEIFEVAQTAPDRNLIRVALQKANMLIATGMLRLDFANSILNVISTPILLGTEVSAIRNSLKTDPEMLAIFNRGLQVQVPGTAQMIPSSKKLVFDAVASINTPQGKLDMARFKEIGAVKGPIAMFHAMTDELSLVPNMVPSKYAAKVEEWVEKGATWTGNNMAEDYTRYVSAHVMKQMTDPIVARKAMTIAEQNAFITIFTNRVQGNYVASQRPILFQGTLGSALGLFQTYQFNLFQQLFRHIQNKDLKTIAVMGGLQTTLYGANGLPLFDAINTHLVGSASINEKHEDAYSYAVKSMGKEWGDWMMYGTASAFPLWSDKAPALYTRGDLNPRSVFVLPTSPMDVPAVAGTLKAVNSVLTMAKQIGGGADVTDALLFGLEHNGISRPLAGLAQSLKGESTTSKGNLISSSADFDAIATASRLIGAKPMDESIAINTMYRARAYQAMDKEKIDKIGGIVKDKMRNNEPLTSEDWQDFQARYAASGGRIEGFSQAVQRWNKAANTSIINSLRENSNTVAGRRLNEVMGADPLEDYSNTPQTPE